MSSRSRTYPASSTQRPLGGQLHEMATTRHIPAPRGAWWTNPHLGGQGLMRGSRMFVLGQPGRGKTALVRKLHVDARRRRVAPVVVFDEVPAFTPVNLPLVAGAVFDPLAWAPRHPAASIRAAGEW